VNGVNQRPVGELFEDLTNDTRTLLSLELELLRAEMTQKARQAGKDVGFIAAGGFVIYAGFIAIVAAVAFGLGNFIPTWLAFLIVGVVVALIGYVVMRKGLDDLKSRSMAPEKTITSLKQDKEWLQRERAQ
jgi:large-conductance mechanosensitive channel